MIFLSFFYALYIRFGTSIWSLKFVLPGFTNRSFTTTTTKQDFFTRNRRLNTKFEINCFVYYLQLYRLHEVVQFSITDRIKVLKSVHLTLGVQKIHFSIFGLKNRVFRSRTGVNAGGKAPKTVINARWVFLLTPNRVFLQLSCARHQSKTKKYVFRFYHYKASLRFSARSVHKSGARH